MKNPTLTLIFNKQNVLIGASLLEAAEDISGVNTTQEITESCDNKTTTSSGYSYRYLPNNDINYVDLLNEMTLEEFDAMK